MSTSRIESEYRHARALHSLPDTPEMRRCFYAGARAAFNRVSEDDSTEPLLAFNDELRAFAKREGTDAV